MLEVFIFGIVSIALAVVPFVIYAIYHIKTQKFFVSGKSEGICFLDLLLIFVMPMIFFELFKNVVFYPTLYFLAFIFMYFAFISFKPSFERSFHSIYPSAKEENTDDKSIKKTKRRKKR